MKMYLGICKGYYAKVKLKLTRNTVTFAWVIYAGNKVLIT